jgi:hypothetical protein
VQQIRHPRLSPDDSKKAEDAEKAKEAEKEQAEQKKAGAEPFGRLRAGLLGPVT